MIGRRIGGKGLEGEGERRGSSTGSHGGRHGLPVGVVAQSARVHAVFSPAPVVVDGSRVRRLS